jgi:hypothetical protein
MGKTKSTKFKVLLEHLGIQWVVLTLGLWCCMGLIPACELSALNTVVHGLIDWNIWRGYKISVYKRLGGLHPLDNAHDLWRNESQEWEYWNDHWFYATIGLDQLLHGLTLIVIYGVFL